MVAGAQAACAYLSALIFFIATLAFILDLNTYSSHLSMSKVSSIDDTKDQHIHADELPAPEQVEILRY